MARWIFAALGPGALLVALLAACGGGAAPATPTSAPVSPVATPHLAVATPWPGDCPTHLLQPERLLWPAIHLGKPAGALVRFNDGESVAMSFTVQNCGSEPVHVTYRSSQRYEFVVKDAAGEVVWRWSRDKTFAQVVAVEEFERYQSLTYVETWDQRDNQGDQVRSGRYTVTATLVGKLAAEEEVSVLGCPADQSGCVPSASQSIAISP